MSATYKDTVLGLAERMKAQLEGISQDDANRAATVAVAVLPVPLTHEVNRDEPKDGSLAILVHPATGQPLQVFHRDDKAAVESGYADDDGDERWYEVVESPEAPCSWRSILDDHDGGPILTFRMPAAV